MPSTHIGTSGWQHDPFAGRFYPDDVSQDDWLAQYADTFGTVEVNNTFYQSPEPDTLRAWRRQTPDGFTFAVKANQYITHFKKLKDPDEPVQNLYRNVEPLGDALGPSSSSARPTGTRTSTACTPFWRRSTTPTGTSSSSGTPRGSTRRPTTRYGPTTPRSASTTSATGPPTAW